jgi:hypothetical protein
MRETAIDFTLDSYRVLRGCIDHNLGEPIIPNPETIPLELIQLADICVSFLNIIYNIFHYSFSNIIYIFYILFYNYLTLLFT